MTVSKKRRKREWARLEEKVTVERAVAEHWKAQFDETSAVLLDLLHGRDQSWLAQLASYREYLFAVLSACGAFNGGRCLTCFETSWHFRDCVTAYLLRVLGGEKEIQKQVDAAHEVALELAINRELHLNEEYPLQLVSDALKEHFSKIDLSSDLPR